MKASVRRTPSPQSRGASEPKVSKKEQILALFSSGISQVEDLALITHSRPSYVASVLHASKLLPAYFDLYTSTAHPMNVYSKFFSNKLGYKDEATARESARLIDHLYRQFELAEDRSGQHHALLMALTMFNRARWTGKLAEADVFRDWLIDRLSERPAEGPAPVNAARPANSDNRN